MQLFPSQRYLILMNLEPDRLERLYQYGEPFSFVGVRLLNNNVDWLEKLNNFSFAVHNENNELIQKERLVAGMNQ